MTQTPTREAVRERPINFGAEAVRALLAGRKTQERRAVLGKSPVGVLSVRVDEAGYLWWSTCPGHENRGGKACPFGRPGDRLVVKERWRTAKSLDDLSPGQIAAKCDDAGYTRPWCPIEYAADGDTDHADTMVEGSFGTEWGRWRSPLHMPRWASRLTLELTGVRVDRVHDTTLGDIVHELGCTSIYDFKPVQSGISVFAGRWDATNPTHPWSSNPWVWVLDFRRVET